MTPRLSSSRRALGIAALLSVAALSGCGDDARDAVPAERPPETPGPAETTASDAPADAVPAETGPSLRVTVSDTLGTFEGEVHGLALWEHPDLSFASAVLAANGSAGLAVIPVDVDVDGTLVEGTYDGPVAVGYTEDASFAAARSGGEIVLFTVTPDRAFTRIGAVAAQPDALCMIGKTLLAVGKESKAYMVADDGSAAPVFTKKASPNSSCAAADGRFFVGPPGGPVTSYAADGSATMVDDAYDTMEVAGLAALDTPSGVSLLTTEGGNLVVDGPSEPHVIVTAEREGAPIGPITAIAAGSGNFGSIYRDGVVALVADSELVLVPWAGVARAAGLSEEEAESASLRPRPAVPEPELQIDLPEIDSALNPVAPLED